MRQILGILLMSALLGLGFRAAGQPLTKAETWREHRTEYDFAIFNDLLKGTADTTVAAFIQGFEGCDAWPGTWALETWAICKTQVPDSHYYQWRYKIRPGGDWSAWANVDSLAATAFTTGATGHQFTRLTLPAVKPWAIQFRAVQKDASAACSSWVYQRLYVWP